MNIYGKIDCPCGSDDGPLATTATGSGALACWYNGNNGADGNSQDNGGGASSFDFSADRNWAGSTNTVSNHSHTITINNTGSGNAHNNLQPYLVVNMWKRTA